MDGLTSFAQIDQMIRVVCRGCGETGHYGWDCQNISAQERARLRAVRGTFSTDDKSVSSNGSYRSDSQSSLGSRSSGSASRNDRRGGGALQLLLEGRGEACLNKHTLHSLVTGYQPHSAR